MESSIESVDNVDTQNDLTDKPIQDAREVNRGDNNAVTDTLSTDRPSEAVIERERQEDALALKKEDYIGGDFIFQLILALAVLLSGAFVLLKTFKSKIVAGWGVTKKDSVIEIREAKRLSARTQVYLLNVDGQSVLVAENTTAISTQILEKPCSAQSSHGSLLNSKKDCLEERGEEQINRGKAQGNNDG